MNSTPTDCGEYNCAKDHAFHIAEDGNMITLVKGGKRAYLSASSFRGSVYAGNGRTLRKLAEAILRECPAPAPKKAKARKS